MMIRFIFYSLERFLFNSLGESVNFLFLLKVIFDLDLFFSFVNIILQKKAIFRNFFIDHEI